MWCVLEVTISGVGGAVKELAGDGANSVAGGGLAGDETDSVSARFVE